MELDWVAIWQEFENELNEYTREGGENTWEYQQNIIERIIGRNLTQRAGDGAESVCPECGAKLNYCTECEKRVTPRA